MIHQLFNYCSEIPIEPWKPRNPLKRFFWNLATPITAEYESCLKAYSDFMPKMLLFHSRRIVERENLEDYLVGYENHRIFPSLVNYLIKAKDFYSCFAKEEVTQIVDVGGGIGLSGWAHKQVNPYLVSCKVADPNPRIPEYLERIDLSNPITEFHPSYDTVCFSGSHIIFESACRCFSTDEVHALVDKMVREKALGVQFIDRNRFESAKTFLSLLQKNNWEEITAENKLIYYTVDNEGMFERVFRNPG